MTSGPIRVFSTAEQEENNKNIYAAGKPAHWVNAKGSSFVNPWPSFREHGFSDFVTMVPQAITNAPKIPSDLKSHLPVIKPTWAAQPSEASLLSAASQDKIKATWLGHACFLVELPSNNASELSTPRGPRILFDPVFSDRCSPSQHIGPKRFTEPPCKIEEIPEFDAIVISHNHYDHMDTHTLTQLTKRKRTPHVFAPLGNRPYLQSLGIANDHIHVLDWWEARRVEIEVTDKSAKAPMKHAFDVTCTPAQHFTGRGLTDRFKTLWASWVVTGVPLPSDSPMQGAAEGVKIYFAGDTGYCAVRDGVNEDDLPVCPAFKEIGEHWGGFNFAMIPIGAYMPRRFMSPIHCSPADSVRVFRDIGAKKALGMHWGTWVLTTEDVLEPPVKLAEECKKLEISAGDFDVCHIGETRLFS